MRRDDGTRSYLAALLGLTVLVFAGIGIANPSFLSGASLSSMAYQFPEFGLLALAILPTMLSGGIDLSVVSIANLASIVAALLLKSGYDGLAVPLALGTGLACGVLNGVLIGYLRLPAILATLGTMQAIGGLGIVVTGGPAVTGLPDWYAATINAAPGAIPVPLILFIVVLVALSLLLRFSSAGVQARLYGANPVAARFAGIPGRRLIMTIYVTSGLISALAGLLILGHANSAYADYGTSYVLLVVLINILAGVSPAGGSGTVSGIVMAVLLLQFISSGLNFLSFSAFLRDLFFGLLLVIVMSLRVLASRVRLTAWAGAQARVTVQAGNQPFTGGRLPATKHSAPRDSADSRPDAERDSPGGMIVTFKNKVFVAGMALALVGSASVCQAQSKKYAITTVVKIAGIAWFNRMDQGVQQFAKDTGQNASQVGPASADAALQNQIVQDLIAKKVDAITVVPNSPESMEPVLKKALDSKIVVVGHEGSNLENVTYDVEAFDNSAFGAHLMDNLAKAMGEEGEYAVFVGHLTAKTHNQWVDAAIARQKEKYPKMHLVADKQESLEDQQVAYSKTKELLQAHPNLKGIQGSASTDVAGAALAVEDAGLGSQVSVVGTSLPSIAGPYIASGTIKAISFWDPAKAAYVVDKVAVMALDGKKVADGMNLGQEGYEKVTLKGHVITGQAWVDCTKDNLSSFNF